MDVSDPTRAITGALEGAVLAALASVAAPQTVNQLAEHSSRGSAIAIRRTLERLVVQGIALETRVGRVTGYSLNREHIAAPIAQELANLRLVLHDRFRAEFKRWKARPLLAYMFGSAARGDGDEDSDIDLLLVRPPFKGESAPVRGEEHFAKMRADSRTLDASLGYGIANRETWERQVADLREQVQLWTGNELQVVELSVFEWEENRRAKTDFIANLGSEAVDLFGTHQDLKLPR